MNNTDYQLSALSPAYFPNFDDPRVIKRIINALGFSIGVLSENTPRQWSSRYIDNFFGQPQNPLSKYLRQKLLICTSERYSKDQGYCKEYILNEDGYNELRAIVKPVIVNNTPPKLNSSLNPSVPAFAKVSFDSYVVKKFITKEFNKELKTGKFIYNTKSHRNFHALQSVKNEYRAPILSDYGYNYNYDIEACAPTLLLQYSRQLGNDLWLPFMDEFLINKTQVRIDLAERAELEIKDVKVLINSLFCGARLGNNPMFSLSQLLNNDESKVKFLQQDEFLTGLRDEIKIIWSYINPTISRSKNLKTKRLKPISSSQRWNVYFQLESEVMSAVRSYLKKNKIKHFLEHDGWVCDIQVDVNQLLSDIELETGFNVKLKFEDRSNVDYV
jgi:hypothetical protein